MIFLNPQAMNPFLETTKYLSITFYLYLSYMCFSLEKKKLANLSNLIAEIRKAKRTEKEIALTTLMKTIAFENK